jgi:hypothetical protein
VFHLILGVSRAEGTREQKHACLQQVADFHTDIFNRRYRKACMILGFHCGVSEIITLLGFYAA